MLRIFTFSVFLACATATNAQVAAAKLVGKWLWQGMDAQATMSFQADHTYIRERFGMEHYHDVRRGRWRAQGDTLTISWSDGTKQVERIGRLTAHSLMLHSEEGWSRCSRVR